MKIVISHISADNGEAFIHFTHDSGACVSRWKPRTFDARIGDEIHVELDVNVIVRMGVNCKLNPCQTTIMVEANGIVTLQGLVVEQDDDGMAYLRLGPDAVIMLEAPYDELKGKWIELVLSQNAITATAIG